MKSVDLLKYGFALFAGILIAATFQQPDLTKPATLKDNGYTAPVTTPQTVRETVAKTEQKTLPGDAGVDRPSPQTSALEDEIDKLKEQLIKLSQSFNQDRETQSPPAQYTLDEVERELLEEQVLEDRRMLYEATLDQQDYDINWSSTAEERVLASLEPSNDRISADSIECKASICRLDISRADGVTDNDALDAFDTGVDWPGEMSLTYDPVTGTGTVYLSRQGSGLPQLPEQ